MVQKIFFNLDCEFISILFWLHLLLTIVNLDCRRTEVLKLYFADDATIHLHAY